MRFEFYAAREGRLEAGECAQQRTLAYAVLAHEAGQLTTMNGSVHTAGYDANGTLGFISDAEVGQYYLTIGQSTQFTI